MKYYFNQLHSQLYYFMLIENLANELQCSICLSLFSVPFVIPCGHSFCRDCIQNYGRATKSAKCPLCKQPFNLNKINLNISLQAVLNVMDHDNTKVKGDVSRQKSKSTNFFICTSNLSDEQKECIERFQKQFKIKSNSNINSKITHLISGPDNPNKPFIARRTLKYLEALVRGIWIVNIDWVIESLKCDTILSEEDFEIRGDEFPTLTPKISRTRGGMYDFLRNYEFGIEVGNINKTIINQDYIETLISLCGGNIVSHKEKTQNTIIIKIVQDPQINHTRIECIPMIVNQKWLFDSISKFNMQNYFGYLISN
ncbi:unnamed protein product [Paramecium pentaurelia]|uniref:RING-type E3 ubiquitin transferase BRCA1 n=1 Tax=Paramecium pentaurelia TaxID=43138 RepID=A0A8S1W3M7_9CILI|nr:unnamed protein product [Paramecium pentaurelia]